MAEQESTIIAISRVRGEARDARDSHPTYYDFIQARMSDGTRADLFTFKRGDVDVGDEELAGLTRTQARALAASRGTIL